jgi:hypothetical protein
MFLKCNYSGDHQVYVYKHAQKSMIQEPFIQKGDFGLTVFPNPVHSSTVIKLTRGQRSDDRDQTVSIKILNISGKIVHRLTSDFWHLASGISWNPANLPAGIYLLKAKIGKITYTKRLLRQ